MNAPVWIVASVETAERWEVAFRAADVPALALPWSAIAPAIFPPDLQARLGRRDFDLVLLTSPNAARTAGPGGGAGIDAACVGEATAQAAREVGFSVSLVGSGTGAELADAMVDQLPPVRVLFLRGRDVRSEGIQILAAAGFPVREEIVYEAMPLPDLGDRVRTAPEPFAVAFGSPRAAEALTGAVAEAGRESILGCPALAVGPPTRDRLVELGFSRVCAPDEPGALGLVALARFLFRGGASP